MTRARYVVAESWRRVVTGISDTDPHDEIRVYADIADARTRFDAANADADCARVVLAEILAEVSK